MAITYADKWALVTGASSGIGAEFTRRLAARGMHLVLTARRDDLLRELAAELDTRHGTKTDLIPGDLTDPAFPQHLFNAVNDAGRQISLLVNNAGFGDVGLVTDADVPKLLNLLQVNIRALTELTYLFLPGMIERKEGAIVNISSVAGFQPVVYMPVYSASKAYVLHFSEALWAECRDHGVTVMALCPGTTRTDFFERAGVGGWLKKHRAQSAEQVVKTALKYLGKGRQYVIPGWLNYFRAQIVRLGPRKIVVQESMKYFRPTPAKADTGKERQK